MTEILVLKRDWIREVSKENLTAIPVELGDANCNDQKLIFH